MREHWEQTMWPVVVKRITCCVGGITPIYSFLTQPLSLSFLHNIFIVPISSLSPRLCDNSASVHFSAFCNNFHGNNSTPNVVNESASEISIFDVRNDSSQVFLMYLCTLQDCQLMLAHWRIPHYPLGKESAYTHKQVNCCIHFPGNRKLSAAAIW